MSKDLPPLVTTTVGTVRGVWRPGSAAFLGIPFAQAPVGTLRFAAPVPTQPWAGVRDATEMGPTPQRRLLAEVTTVPEPSIPGDETLNVNVFTPRPGDPDAALPVLVWIHGGGFIAGSPASPWYDGRAFNRDGVVTVTVSYRLGFDGYGWIDDAPTNRAVRDQILALEWVRDNIAAFGGDPAKVTIAGQSAGGGSVLWLLACPSAQSLFRAVISHSGAVPTLGREGASTLGRSFAERMGVEPTRAGWSALTEDEILDHQNEMAPPFSDPMAGTRALVTGEGASSMLAWGPHVDGDLLPWTPTEARARGIGADKALLVGTVAHEFAMMFMAGYESVAASAGDATEGTALHQLLPALGLTPAAAAVIEPLLASRPVPMALGQIASEFLFRIPALQAAERSGPTWLFDLRWPSPVLGMAYHCIDLPFAWGLLDAPGVTAALGPNPPAALETVMHSAWVQFVSTGDPGWPRCTPGGATPGMVFDTESVVSDAPYGLEAGLVAAMSEVRV